MSKKFNYKVISASESQNYLSNNDKEMDKRAISAVKSAVYQATICKKPIAKYDITSKRAYLEFSNGERKYVE